MRYLKKFFLFWYGFLIGDDWLGAAIILAGCMGTYELSKNGTDAYWFLPLIVLLSVAVSLMRQVRSTRK